MAKRFKINYSEGDCFVLPLENGGYARGVIARLNGKGIVLSYFFLPKYRNIEEAVIDEYLIPNNSIYIQRHGDLGLIKSHWKIIGKIKSWCHDNWPIPTFGQADSIRKQWGELRYYSDDLQTCRGEKVPVENIQNLPSDGLAGYGYMERALSLRINKLEKNNKE
ncbi:MAG: immunity 26/phosphotriesterase HocA family protein [Planctomycetaceae bacterium]|jgi:hypothetical protein|nr:immunity 26/phosphotriesterase HocA family protein [Planctomycetaceae bacterium]